MLGLNIFLLFADKARCVPAVYEHKLADETLAPQSSIWFNLWVELISFLSICIFLY